MQRGPRILDLLVSTGFIPVSSRLQATHSHEWVLHISICTSYSPLELTAVTMHDDHFHILDNTSTNPENDAVPELTVDALEVIELAVIVIP